REPSLGESRSSGPAQALGSGAVEVLVERRGGLCVDSPPPGCLEEPVSVHDRIVIAVRAAVEGAIGGRWPGIDERRARYAPSRAAGSAHGRRTASTAQAPAGAAATPT